jgi:hypothetical protein
VKPPWMNGSQETAELEALQTDVMRFIAILGLCLAAIFSLVHSAAVEQAAATAPLREEVDEMPLVAPASDEPASAIEYLDTAVPPEADLAYDSKRHTQLEPEPEFEPPLANKGYTLEFSSADSLNYLLQTGQVSLYVSQGEHYWSVDVPGKLTRVVAPQSYYRMHPNTVPRELRQSLSVLDSSVEAIWGVTLPRMTVEQILQLTAKNTGGSLVIGRDGVVSLD